MGSRYGEVGDLVAMLVHRSRVLFQKYEVQLCRTAQHDLN